MRALGRPQLKSRGINARPEESNDLFVETAVPLVVSVTSSMGGKRLLVEIMGC